MKNTNSAYLSFNALWAEPITVQRLKIATLLFDKIFFEMGNDKNFISTIIEIYGGSGKINSESEKLLSEKWISNDQCIAKYSIYGVDNKWSWTHAPEKLKEATKITLKQRFNDDGPKEYDNYKYGGYCMSDILFWEKNFPKSTFIGNTTTYYILKNLLELEKVINNSNLQTIDCPDIFDISWNDIVDLSRSDFLRSFRKKYNELSAKNDTMNLMEHYINGLIKLSDTVRPNSTGEVFKAMVSNLPITPNPVSIFNGLMDVSDSFTLKNEFGWLFFITDLRKKIDNAE